MNTLHIRGKGFKGFILKNVSNHFCLNNGVLLSYLINSLINTNYGFILFQILSISLVTQFMCFWGEIDCHLRKPLISHYYKHKSKELNFWFVELRLCGI